MPRLAVTFAISTSIILGSGRQRAAVAASPAPPFIIHECPNNAAGPLDTPLAPGICATPADDASALQTGVFMPWATAPICVSSSPSSSATAAAAATEKLCVFTAKTPSRSLSLLTTPEIAAAAAAEDLLNEGRDPRWLASSPHHHHYGTPGRQRHDDTTAALTGANDDGCSPSWISVTVPGKGRGVVARRAIHAGEVVMAERPVLLRPLEFGSHWLPVVGEAGLVRLLVESLRGLGDVERARVLGMGRSTGGDVVDDVFNTNSFGVPVAGVEHSALFPDVGLINHACRPNVFGRYTESASTMEVVAYTDIKEGEELSLSYVPLNLQFLERRDMLHEWGFECSCELCSSPTSIEVSDRRKQRIQTLLSHLHSSKKLTRKGVQRLTQEVLDLSEREAMLAQIGDFHYIVAKILSRAGETDLAREHAKLAVNKLSHYGGLDNSRTKEAFRLLGELDNANI